MKTHSSPLAPWAHILMWLAFTGAAFAGAFTSGNLVVLRADGTTSNTTCTIVELDRITPGQTPSNTVGIVGTGANALRISGSAGTTGYLAATNDGRLLCFNGVNSTDTSTNANALNPRGVGTLNPAGTFALQTTYTGTSGNQTRGSTSLNNSNWFIADQGGVYSNGTTAASPALNLSCVKSFGGIVYGSQAKVTTSSPVQTITAATGGSMVSLPGLPLNASGTNVDFYLISSGSNGATFDVLYILNFISGSTGRIDKFSLVSGSWTANSTYTTNFGGLGMVAEKNGGGASLYVTSGNGATAANTVVKLADTAGYNSAINITTASNVVLHTTATGTILKGIAFAPSNPIVNLSVSSSTGSEAGATAITVTATASTAVIGDQTVNVAVTGTGITTGDYTLSNTTITIPGGSTTGSVTFTVVDDVLVEGTETATLTISSPSSGIVLGTTTAQNITITDNDVMPVVTGITPTSGSTAGGTGVTITGTGFTGATSVTIGGVAATGVAVVDSNTITASTGAHAAGVVDVSVTTPVGTGTGTGLYTYVAASPTVTSIAPSSGSTAGGTGVTITGTGFTGATAVTIGGVAATGVAVVNSTTITATTGAHAAGAVDVAVTTPVGTGTGTGIYTYVVPAPNSIVTIIATDPNAAEAGNDPGTLRISRTGDTTNALQVNYTVATGAGQATNGIDYTPSLTGAATIAAGQAFVDITITPVDDTLLEGDETVTLTLSGSASYDLGAATTATVTITDHETAVDLSRYVRVGRYNLPEPTTTTPPDSISLLAQEASSVTYNWDTDTLFVVGDGGTSVVQVSKTGQLINSMTLAPNASRRAGTEFDDTEGVTYIGNNQFVMTEERDRTLVRFTYAPGTTLTRANAQTVKLGTTIGNIGLEGVCWDPMTSGFIVVKEKTPESIFQTGVDFTALTATNGSPTSTASTDLFNPSLINLLDFSDVFCMSNLPALTGKSTFSHLLVISQESGQVSHIDRNGTVYSTLTIVADPGSPLTVPDMTMEGVTMDRNGFLYIVNENGGGDAHKPQLWVYAPSTATNLPPTAVALANPVSSIPENTSTAADLKVADIIITDDGLGVNTLNVSGPDAAFFKITGTALFLKAGTTLSSTSKPSYSVVVNVDDTSVGSTPDASTGTYTLNVTASTGGTAQLIISEVAPWSSGAGPASLRVDWFEVTNIGTATQNITGWKMDDNSNSFGSAVALLGITSIAPGESVIFLETADASPATIATKKAAFLSTWFGANPPASLQVGAYSGSGVGLSTTADAVNIFDAAGVVQARVDFNASPAGPSFPTFDNGAGLNNVVISSLSAVGVNGAFLAAGDSNEIGSPGTIGASGTPVVTIVATDPNASETGPDPGTFRISRTGSTVGALTVNYTIATGPGQATSADYTPTLTGVVTIPSGQAFTDITITPVDDALVESSEALTLTLGDTGSYDVGSPASATVTITDNDTSNLPPTAVTLSNTVPLIIESASTASDIKVADISITDDGIGTNTLSVSGADAASFKITGTSLFLKAGTTLSYATKPVYNVTVNVDDTTVGATPDASTNFVLTITQAVPPGAIIVSEVAPWSSGNSPIAVDWFEVTNVGPTTLNTTGWKWNDDALVFSSAVALNGITSIAPGESVIFMQTTDLPGKSAAFKTLWFGSNPPAGLQFGSYTGPGLSSSGDSVNIFDSVGNRLTGIHFGTSPTGTFATFDNKAGIGSTTTPLPNVITLSAIGVNGALAAVNDASEVGSPGRINNPTAVESWRQTFFGTTSNTGNAANNADPDGDGLNNLLELAFGMNPTVNSPGALKYSGTFAGSGQIAALGTPITMSETTVNGTEFRALFVRRTDFLAAGLTYTVQFSADLTLWQDSLTTPTVLADDGSCQIVSVPYPAQQPGQQGLFFRVQVSLAP